MHGDIGKNTPIMFGKRSNDLLGESIKMMKLSDNATDLDALAKAIPAAKPMIDTL